MRRRIPRPIAVAAALGLVLLALLLAPGEGARSSSLSRGSDGWWALRAYLEARGVETRRIDRPLDSLRKVSAAPEAGRSSAAASSGSSAAASSESAELGRGVLVLALPWQKAFLADHSAAVRDHLRGGGDVLVGYDFGRLGESSPRLWNAVGIAGTRSLRPAPPLAPVSWWRHRHERWTLEPTEGFAGGPRLELRAFDLVPHPPAAAEVLYVAPEADAGERGASGAGAGGRDGQEGGAGSGASTAGGASRAAIYIYPRLRGRVVVLPSALFSNAELWRGANADFAETLRRELPGPWLFDEYHHGVVAPELAEEEGTAYAWDLFVGHLALLYVLGVWSLARRFGPAWREPVRHHGSTAAFLRSLGALHHRLGHHGEAARLLVRRVHELDSLPLERLAALEARAEEVRDGEDLVRLGRSIR